MSWRIVIIENRCKLDLKMGYMVVRGEDVKRIFLDEIAILVIENPAVSLTGCLLEALVNKKVKVIFCDSKHSPMAELTPYYGSHDCSRKLRAQILWSEPLKSNVWREIVADKIRKQGEFLFEIGREKEAQLVLSYISQIEPGDITNREGHSAKVYFNGIFGMNFTRSEENVTNAALNYGYSIILSTFNREIVSSGYITQLGLFHDNMFNHFNLSCDLMEPYRVFVDRLVYKEKFNSFETYEKHMLWSLLNSYVRIDNEKQTLLNSIKIYTRSVFETLNNSDFSNIKFPMLLK